MSTAPSGTPPETPSAQPGQMPGPWALLAATAVGSVIGTRLSRAPWVLAAGAAALALLQKKKSTAFPAASPAPLPREPAPTPPDPPDIEPRAAPALSPPAAHAQSPSHTHDSMQSQVAAWLSRQIQREMEEPVLDLGLQAPKADAAPAPAAGQAFFPADFAMPAAAAASAPVHEDAGRESPEDEDDYDPGAFLLDEMESPRPPVLTQKPTPVRHASFARLMEPPDSCIHLEPCAPAVPQETTAGVAAQTAPPPPQETEPPHAWTAAFSSAPKATSFHVAETATVQAHLPADATQPLDLEPLPSLTEAKTRQPTAGELFFAAPPPLSQVECAPAPEVMAPTDTPAPFFEGAAFPDAIEVPMAFGRAEIPSVLFKEKAPSPEHTPAGAGTQALAGAYPAQPHVSAAMSFLNRWEPAQEIEVKLAAQGEAPFDPPHAATPEDSWQAQVEAIFLGAAVSAPDLQAETGLQAAHTSAANAMPGGSFWETASAGAGAVATALADAPAPTYNQPSGPMVDAEIVITPRPQDATRPVFVAKPRPLAPSFATSAQNAQVNLHLHLHAHPHAGMPASPELPAEQEPPLPSPLQPPGPRTHRSSRQSWWQGD